MIQNLRVAALVTIPGSYPAAAAHLVIAATLGFVALVLALTLCRQPTRRLSWARAGIAALALIIPIIPLTHATTRFPRIPIKLETTSNTTTTTTTTNLHPAAAAFQRAAVIALAAGSVSLLLSYAFACLASQRMRRTALRPSPDLRDLHRALEQPGDPPVRLVICPNATRPVLIGFFRPTIVLPASLENANEETRISTLIHERIHALRGDHRWAWLSALVCAFWFYLPMAWWVRAQMRLDDEMLTDHEAARRLGSHSDYARSLLDVAKPEISPTPQPTSAQPRTPSALVPRILMIVRKPFPLERNTPPLATLAIATTATLTALTLGSLQIAWPRQPPPNPASHATAPAWRIARLTIAPRAANAPSTPATNEILGDLPPAFDLQFELEDQGQALAATTICGHPLAGQPTATPSTTPQFVPIHYVKDSAGVRIWVDGVLTNQHPGHPHDDAILRIDPPNNEPITIRNLRLDPLINPNAIGHPPPHP